MAPLLIAGAVFKKNNVVPGCERGQGIREGDVVGRIQRHRNVGSRRPRTINGLLKSARLRRC